MKRGDANQRDQENPGAVLQADPANSATGGAADPTQDSAAGQIILLEPDDEVGIHPVAARLSRPEQHLAKLKTSINEHGQLTPVAVAVTPDGEYELLSGVSRWIVCRDLGRPCRAVVIAFNETTDGDDFRIAANLWVAAECEASQHDRGLTPAQRALDAARLCKEVFEPSATARRVAGKRLAANEEAGESRVLAARSARVTRYMVERGEKLLGTFVEPYIQNGLVAKLADAVRIAGLQGETADKADALLAKGRVDDVLSSLRPTQKSRFADFYGEPVRDDVAAKMAGINKTLQKKLAALETLQTFVEASPGDLPETLVELGGDLLRALLETIKESLPFRACRCGDAGCDACSGRSWLTRHEFEAVKQSETRSETGVP
ncbi:MAG: hypothetical protein CMJ58_00420 [Planctomycetaceae bacterium]|nr:hypothetical protein [Planctomycetaceae bacterium]